MAPVDTRSADVKKGRLNEWGDDGGPTVTERTRLLDNSYDELPADTWDGAAEFADLSWWQRPSVRSK
jgi:hypothetical protein